jgi:hypothetical protein
MSMIVRARQGWTNLHAAQKIVKSWLRIAKKWLSGIGHAAADFAEMTVVFLTGKSHLNRWLFMTYFIQELLMRHGPHWSQNGPGASI